MQGGLENLNVESFKTLKNHIGESSGNTARNVTFSPETAVKTIQKQRFPHRNTQAPPPPVSHPRGT
jgi:hypothetical protein